MLLSPALARLEPVTGQSDVAEADIKRLKAEKLALQAELAELEAERLEKGARQLSPPPAPVRACRRSAARSRLLLLGTSPPRARH
ncbi:hypothetical protein OAO87_00155 [bacterium]|nr:hypothetical protein [bacterium]